MAAHFWPGSREKPSLCRSPCRRTGSHSHYASKPGYATAETGRSSQLAERVTPACPHFGACGGCHYQHTGYETQRAFKQPSCAKPGARRRGRAGEIAVLAAKPWAYRNRIRLASMRRKLRLPRTPLPCSDSHPRVPIAAPLLLQAHTPSRKLHGNFPQPCAPLKSLFCDAGEPRCWQVSYCQRQGDSFRRFTQTLHERIPALKARNWWPRATRPTARTIAQWGAPSLAYRARASTIA